MTENGNNLLKIFGIIIGSLITVVTTLSLFITTGLRNDISRIDNNLMAHLTNHEIHCPRTAMMSKNEFETYKYVFNDKIANLKTETTEIRK